MRIVFEWEKITNISKQGRTKRLKELKEDKPDTAMTSVQCTLITHSKNLKGYKGMFCSGCTSQMTNNYQNIFELQNSMASI